MKQIVAGIVAHVDAGKTTLNEALLYTGGQLRRLGRVDHGDTLLDSDALERRRGITIFSKQAELALPEAEITCDGKEIDAVYDTAKKNEKDKYAVYFGGNYGEVDIRMKNPDNDRTLVIFKDSFANSMVPFLMKDYAQIRMIDLRYFKRSVSKYMEENPADEVLVLYEMSSFAQADKLNKLMK